LAPQALSATTTSSAAAATCTASLTTTLCSYPEPDVAFAIASDSRASCWDYCNDHSPCNFLIFNPGNPYTGTGTCWLYPGETFDASKGSSNCTNPYLSVYSKPVCSGGSATTTTSGACTATATPSAIASVCGYPAPDDCFHDCVASSGAPNCLSYCAEADSCSYVVFNPRGGSTSPYASGTCWIYANGTYNPESTTTCSGDPEQFVYKNLCPKPSASSSSLSSSVTGTAGSSSSAATASTTSSKNSAPTGLSFANPWAIGVAILMGRAL
jgi:hypothetical protein